MALIATIRARMHRRRYVRYLDNEHAKLDALAASPEWMCDRCGLKQTSAGRSVRSYMEGSNYVGVWPRADFVAMSCWDCGAPIIKTVKQEAA